MPKCRLCRRLIPTLFEIRLRALGFGYRNASVERAAREEARVSVDLGYCSPECCERDTIARVAGVHPAWSKDGWGLQAV